MVKAKAGGTMPSDQPAYFLVALSEILAMIGGYEWHRKGVYIDALQWFVFPHFGVFPPTRQDYLPLMDHINPNKTHTNHIHMMEVGIGSGVLSLILLRRQK